MTTLTSEAMTYASAQDLFTAALHDEAVRARLNKAAAESEGWTGIVSVESKVLQAGGSLMWSGLAGVPKDYDAPPNAPQRIPIKDYTRSLTDAARLKENCIVRKRYDHVLNVAGVVIFSTDGDELIGEFDPKHEALARVCCVAAASGWEIAP